MIKIETKSGFKCQISKSRFNDWRFMKTMRDVERGEVAKVVDVGEILLKDDLIKLEDHLEKIEGEVSITSMLRELGEITRGEAEEKNEETQEVKN